MALHVQVLLWFGFALNTALVDSVVSNLLLVGVCMLVSNILRYYLPRKQRYSFVAGLCTVLTLIWFLVSRALILLLASQAGDYEMFFSQSFPVRLAFGFLITGCMTLISVLWYTLQDQQEAEQRRTEAERLAREAELFKLRQQLQPHFLFNSLNSINALIGVQPAQARTMILQLSDFLRGTLKKEEHQWVDVLEELEHLQLYLEIEKVRFGHRLSTEISNETAGNHLLLPAMLLQPVVENAIKFGLYDTTEAITIRLEARKEGSDLVVEVRNPFDSETSHPKKGTGFGLNSVQRRLYLLFARNDLLQTRIQDHQFITTIKIPQHDQGRNHRR